MNEKELQLKKEKAMKCKVISLDLLNHSPLANPTFMSVRDKKKVIKMMETWFEKPDAEVDDEFNDIVNNKILDGKTDLSTFHCPEIHLCD
jgi:hypothetical protein